MKYTNTYEELIEYLDAQMENYIETRSSSQDEKMMTIERYEEEKQLLEKQVNKHPETVREMWCLIFLGKMAEEKGLIIRNQMNQCPFLMYLLKVASYDVLEEGYREENYLYEKTSISAMNFYVGENFYENAKESIDNFFAQTGHIVMWVGGEKLGSFYEFNREPEGIMVFPEETDVVALRNECGQLKDETTCILSECALDMYDKGEWYQFIPMQSEKRRMPEEEKAIIKMYQCDKVDEETVIKVLASGLIDGFYKPTDSYYEIMEAHGDNIYSREDLYQFFLKKGFREERAYYWTEIIRKGSLGWRIEKHKLSYEDYAELHDTLGLELIKLYCNIQYLPTRWSILERFYWLVELEEKNKIIAVDFDGTLSFGRWPGIGAANIELIEFLKERQKTGDKLILWTCREGADLQAAVEWCKEEGLVFDAVNDNLPEVTELYGTNSRKVSCDYYIDDRAVMTNAFGVLK